MKIIYFFLGILLFLPFAFAGTFSEDKTDYYYTREVYYTDNIETLGAELSINGSIIADELSPVSWGNWSIQSYCDPYTCNYTDEKAYKNTFSIVLNSDGAVNSRSNGAQAIKLNFQNTTFTGSIGFAFYDYNLGSTWNTFYLMSNGHLIGGQVETAVISDSYLYRFDGDEDVCDTRVYRSEGWHTMRLDFTSASSANLYVDNILCHNFISLAGVDYLYFMSSAEGAAKSKFFIDDFWVANEARPSTLLSNYSPLNLTPSFQENQTINFSVNITETSTFQWFIDGVLSLYENVKESVYSWYTDMYTGNINRRYNITTYINHSSGDRIELTWLVNITNIYLNHFNQSPINISWNNQLINIECEVNDSTAEVNMYYRVSGGEVWQNITDISSGVIYKSNITTQINNSWIGYIDFKCIADNGISAFEQINYDSVNVYSEIVPPTNVSSMSPAFGKYDTEIPLSCSGSEDYFGLTPVYDMEVSYTHPNNTRVEWQRIKTNSTSGFQKFYILDLPSQNNVSFRCRANNGYNTTLWSEVNGLSVMHGINVNMFKGTYYSRYRPGSHVILSSYCNIRNSTNLRIKTTYSDCNSDGQWDYSFPYSNYTTTTGRNVLESNDYFTCIYSQPGNYSVIVGCVTERIEEGGYWDKSLCKNIDSNDQYCDYSKAYVIEVEGI